MVDIEPGTPYHVEGCKKFIFLGCVDPCGFTFVGLYHKLEKEITAFNGVFSLTAEHFFTDIEITSTTSQRIYFIICEDTTIDLPYINGRVEVANDIFAPGQITNFFPMLNKQGIDLTKYYHNSVWGSMPFTWVNHNISHTDNIIWSPSFRFSEMLESIWHPKNYIERISIIPTTGTQLLLYYHDTGSTTPTTHGFSSTFVEATSPYLLAEPIMATRFYFKDQSFVNFLAGGETELTWTQCPANELTTFELLAPLQIESCDINAALHEACKFLSITTYHPCDYHIRVEGRSFANPDNWGLFTQVERRRENIS